MDKGNFSVDIEQDENKQSNFDSLVTEEDGKQYHVPYRMVRRAVFSGLKKEELVDIPHAARLQYRLMLLDPVIKAKVDFTKQRIIVIYNPRTADNIKDKISQQEIVDILAREGIHADPAHTEEADYDYYKDLYTYAYNPARIRERPPYGYSAEEWKGMKGEYEEKMQKLEAEKVQKFRSFQQGYLEANPEKARMIDPSFKPGVAKPSFFDRLLGRGKRQSKEKGFWFHGV